MVVCLAIKAVFFDIDGTLLTDHRVVHQTTIAAINQLKKQGILVGLATGRDPRFVLKYMASLSIDFVVAYNGQYIFSRDGVIFAKELQRVDMENLIAYAQRHKQDVTLGTATGFVGSSIMNMGMGDLSYRITRLIPSWLTRMVNLILNRWIRKLAPQKSENLMGLLQQPIYQMVVLATEFETKKMQKAFPNLEFTRSSHYAADIISKYSSKLAGIARLGEIYDFSLSEVMAFGDANNDIDMLRGVGFSVAMGNASRKVKLAATYVTESNNRDGIFQALAAAGLVSEDEHVSE